MNSLKIGNKKIEPVIIRKNIIEMAKNGDSVHIGCAFSIVEIVSVLYEKFVRYNVYDAGDSNRDLVCLSKGHGVMTFYSILAEYGIIEKKHLSNYFKDGSLLKGLADSHIPGIEVTGGSLGHGITVAAGQAFALKKQNKKNKVFCIIGDGELNEGSVWESMLFAAHWKLNNFIVIVDANEFQAMGKSEDILNCEPMTEKFKSFNFEVWECDGHSTKELEKAFSEMSNSYAEKPKALIARTIKGKGVSFMEKNNAWHYLRLNDETYHKALLELK